MSKISLYQAANKWVAKESVSISVKELGDYVVKRESETIQVKKASSVATKKR
jgi:hypothetical protein